MNRSDDTRKSSAGRATISTSEQWRAAARKLFGEDAERVNEAATHREPTVTCPKCLLEFVLIFNEKDVPAATYEVACPRCARPFRFVYVKRKPARKKRAKKAPK